MGRNRAAVRILAGPLSPEVRLVALPHSGGRAEAFGAWDAFLPDAFAGLDAQCCAVQYPGHGDRIAEPPVADVAGVAEPVVRELAAMPAAEVILFGHSFGSAVACEVARGLEVAGTPVRMLVASAAWAPGDPARSPSREHARPDEELWSRVVSLGGVDPLVAEEPELRDLLLPALRADITAHERYLSGPRPTPLGCEVHAYHAEADPLVPTIAAAGWDRMSTRGATSSVRPGGHFYLFDHARDLLLDLRRRAASVAAVGAGRARAWPA